MFRSVFLGFAVAAYFWKGLEATGWFLYELNHLIGFESLYYGYSFFRGIGHLFSLWSYSEIFCIGLGFTVALINLHLRKN